VDHACLGAVGLVDRRATNEAPIARYDDRIGTGPAHFVADYRFELEGKTCSMPVA